VGEVSIASRRPFAESSIRVASRRSRVSSRLALTTHQVAALRYPGGCSSQNRHAFRFRRNRLSRSSPELGIRLLERVGLCLRRVPPLERPDAGRRHPAQLGQLPDPPDVLQAPDALRPPRREPDHPPLVVDPLGHAVDPPEGEGLIQSFLVGDPLPARGLLVETHRELRGRVVVLLEPRPELGRGPEESRLDHGWRA
jgi:hypothetical protein